MIKYLAASILMLTFVDLAVTRGQHVQGVVTVIGHFINYVLHMGSGSLFTR